MFEKNLAHYIVVTGILVNSDGKFLICKRADWEKAFPGKWTVPDGIPCVIVSLYAAPKHGEIKLCKALSEYAWVNLEEAKNYDLIEGIYEELEMLNRKLNMEKIESWRG